MAKGKGKRRPPPKRPSGGGGSGSGGVGRATRPPAKLATPAAPAEPEDLAPAPATTQPSKGKPTRTERMEAARKARRRKQLQSRVLAVAVPLLIVVIIAGVMINNRRNAQADVDRLEAGSCTFDRRADDTTSTPHRPVPQSYAVDPPSGGNHDPTPAPAGFYDDGQVPPDNNLVHSLEHGFVIFWHQPGISDDERAQLREIFDDHDNDVIVVPRASLQQKVAATAWGRRLLCGEIEPAALREFIDLYLNDAPEAGIR